MIFEKLMKTTSVSVQRQYLNVVVIRAYCLSVLYTVDINRHVTQKKEKNIQGKESKKPSEVSVIQNVRIIGK